MFYIRRKYHTNILHMFSYRLFICDILLFICDILHKISSFTSTYIPKSFWVLGFSGSIILFLEMEIYIYERSNVVTKFNYSNLRYLYCSGETKNNKLHLFFLFLINLGSLLFILKCEWNAPKAWFACNVQSNSKIKCTKACFADHVQSNSLKTYRV